MYRNQLVAALLTGSILLAVSGCTAVTDAVGGAVSEVGTAIQAEGRGYGKTYELKQDETMKTAFFDLTVNSVTTAETFEDFLPVVEGDQFLVVNVTVTSTLADAGPIPMYYSDFELKWEAAGEETILPDMAFAEDQLADEYELAEGESSTGNLIFEVPNAVSAFDFKFYEVWDDEFEGNTYWMALAAEA